MKCFVIMPFGDPQKDAEQVKKSEHIYIDWIKPLVETIEISKNKANRITCHRADKESRPGEIIDHIIENLIASEIVIADLSGRNPNVFYELGVRHSVNNNTILIANNLDDIPFDLRGLRTIVYSYDPEGMIKLKNSLSETMHSILATPEKIDNPVRRFLYERELENLVKNNVPPGYDPLKEIISQVSSLRQQLYEQSAQTQQVLSMLTSQEHLPHKVQRESVDISFFEGIWKRYSSNGRHFARIVNGQLYVPYSFSGGLSLESHFYNCRVVDNTLIARFKWFYSNYYGDPISGYVILRVESEDRLVGGWWPIETLPLEVLQDPMKVNEQTHGMVKMILERETKATQFPSWVEKYFEEHMYENEDFT